MANKVKYGIENLYYSVISTTGTYGSPIAWKGAVSISLSPQGSQNNFYADNSVYFSLEANTGYQGDLVTALIPDTFRTDCLGETVDTNGMYVETAGATRKEFALLFQFEGDENATRHCLYRCTATRPNVEGSTVEDTIEPQTETITITAMPRLADHVVKSRCPYSASTTSAYALWFDAVQEPTASA